MTTQQRTNERLQEWLNGDQSPPAEPWTMTKKRWLKLAAFLVGSLAVSMAAWSSEGGVLVGAAFWAFWAVLVAAALGVVWFVVWLKEKKEERDEREERKSGRA